MVRRPTRAGHAPGPANARRAPAVLVALCLFLLSGCGPLGEVKGDSGGSTAPEPTTIDVGIMPSVDVAPLHLAMREGYFERAGLRVEPRTISGGADGIPLLNNGSLDITFSNWVTFFRAQQREGVELRAVSDGYQADTGTLLLMHMPGGPVSSPSDLAGEKIAVNTRSNITELTTSVTLKTHGLQPSDVEFVVMDFSEMPAALQRGDVAAAAMIEPFASRANRLGAETLADTAKGPTTGMPIAGYASTRQWVERHRDAAARFQRVMARAQAEVGKDRGKVEDLLPQYTEIDPSTAALVNIGSYPTTLDASRLERVVELMRSHGVLPSGDVDVESMLFEAPPKK
ncbi:NitT/TauT family transport system substrate-binding protein [Saccharopolyspora lacisalsi]|uniref:NitT/TauT family transport system substrate-binding protein n=1 Tax=Halosaccharopolyspora lacisalsi TaxID=1000566 RepID=A0A839E4G1_9PSEU|nr:ABC transporter substrate-binding protein [Halosaccharopolyspora lacisalsi]MBA8826705.1 NitT/TauT family transport system substrate-binding protein [Halosaccharopolyspora lacisalsi]